MAFNTQNPVPSNKPEDLSDNAKNLDSAMQSDAPTWRDRLGVDRITMKEYERRAQQAVDNIDIQATLVTGVQFSTLEEAYENLSSIIPEKTRVIIDGDTDENNGRYYRVEDVLIKTNLQPASEYDVNQSLEQSSIALNKSSNTAANLAEYQSELNENAGQLKVVESSGTVAWHSHFPPDVNGQSTGSYGVDSQTGELVARYPTSDPRIMQNVDARLRDALGALCVADSGVDRVEVTHHDIEGRWVKWNDYRPGYEGVYFMGEKLGEGGTPPVTGGTARGIDLNGQSNEVGQAGGQRSLPYGEYYPSPDRVMMPLTAANNIWLGVPGTGTAPREILASDITDLTRLRSVIASTNSHGTTSGEGFAYAQLSKPNPFANFDGFAFFNTAEGNQSIANMLEDAPVGQFYFKNKITCVTRINALYNARGQRYVVDITEMAHGESGRTDPAMGEKHNLLRSQLNTRYRAITGQISPLRMFSWQMSNFFDVAIPAQSNGANANLSILKFALDNAAEKLFFCPGPTYMFPFSSDFLHFTSVGHAMRGEYFNAIISIFDQVGEYSPLYVTQAAVTGANQITLTYSEACVIDNSWLVAATENAGVRLRGGEISSVTSAGQTVVVNTVGPAASVTAVEVGLKGHQEPSRTQAGIPRSNIRSVAAIGVWSSIVGGASMYKPACHQLININE